MWQDHEDSIGLLWVQARGWYFFYKHDYMSLHCQESSNIRGLEGSTNFFPPEISLHKLLNCDQYLQQE